MIRSYDKLGMTELRDDTERVLTKNYPNSAFLDEGNKPNASGGTSGSNANEKPG
jgi:outer membrane protein assembly factor BamD (BamD/ComL family)